MAKTRPFRLQAAYAPVSTKARSSRSGPLTFRFLTGLTHALLLQAFAVLARIGLVYD